MTPFLHEDAIEGKAQRTIDEYLHFRSSSMSAPIDVEDILESFLELTLEFDDLCAKYKSREILGASWIPDRRVSIDNSINPAVHPEQEGRYRFTVAHEIGHWQLHRGEFLQRARQCSLLPNLPNFICRENDKIDRKELQANLFASYLLMPSVLVRDYLIKTCPGQFSAAQWADALSSSNKRNAPFQYALQTCTRHFQVSRQAMCIRLEKFRSIPTGQLTL